MKKTILLLGLLMSMVFIGGQVMAQTYTYTYSPAYQTFTDCGSGTTTRTSLSYSGCALSSGTTSYQRGQVRAAVWLRGSSTGSIKFRVEKCSGYFSNGNSGKVLIHDQYSGVVYCTDFSISNSTTSFVYGHVHDYGDFTGSRTFHVYLITSNLTYKFYAGAITITGASANQPPTTPSSPTPSNGATGVATSTTLSWSSSDPEGGSLSYDLYRGTSSSNLQLYASGQGTSKYVTGMSNNTTYYWKVLCYDNQNNCTHGPVWHFTTAAANQPPTTPSSPTPSNGATGVATSTTLSWSSSDPEGGSLSYDLYRGTSSSNLQLYASGQGTSKYVTGMSSNTTYYWKVLCYDNQNNCTHGPVWHFTTAAASQPPTTPSNPTPSNGATGVSVNPTLSWTCTAQGSSISYYEVYVRNSDSSYNQCFYPNQSTFTIPTSNTLSNGTVYYWRVRARDNNGQYSQGPLWHFTTVAASQPPTTPSNPTPSNGATGISVNPTLSWTCTAQGSSISYYEVYVRNSDSSYNECFYPNQSTFTIPTSNTLSNGTVYYWRVRARSNNGQFSQGPLWHFTTVASSQPPTTPSNPTPSNGATGVSVNPTLSWTCTAQGSSISYYEVYVRNSDSSYNQCFYPNQSTFTIPTSNTLSNGTVYYWRVRARSNNGQYSQGPLWHFTTENIAGNDCFNDCSSSNCGSYGNQMYTAAQYLCNLNIVEGVNGDLDPDDSITRAQLAKVALYSLYNGPSNVPSTLVSDYFPSIYPDLQDNTTYYYRAAKALLYLEYRDQNNSTQLDGISPFDRDRSVFNPSGYIERCLVLKVLMETFNIKPVTGGTSSFDDYGPTGYSSSAFWGYAQKAYNLGIVQTTHFRPNEYCTRGEAFLYLYRMLTSSNVTRPTPTNTSSAATSDFFIPTNLSPEVVNAMRGVEYGNFNYYEKDFFNIPGYMNLGFGVAYNSYQTEMPDDIYPVKPLGKAWTHTYDMYMNVVTDNYNNRSVYIFHMQDGKLLMYVKNGNIYNSLTEGNYYTLTTSGLNTFILTATNQVSYTFTRQSVSDGIYYLTKIKDRNDNAITITYANGNNHYRISSVSTAGRTLNFYYSTGSDMLARVKDPANRNVYFYYTDGQLTSLKDAKNQTTSFSYGTLNFEKGLLKEITLPKGNHVYNNYQQRKLTSMSRTSSNGSTFTDIAMSTNYQNGTSSSTVTENLSSGQSVSTSYTMNNKSRITNVTSGSHTDLSYQYNVSGKPDLISSATNNKTNVQASFTYNNKGKMTSSTITAGGQTHTTSTTYTSLNDIHTITDANGNTTTYNYNSSGNLSGITDALGHTTSITNNSHGLPTQITNPMGVSTNYTYNNYGNTSTISIPSLNLSSSMSYDNVSRLTSATDFANHTTTYTYDDNDNLVTTTDPLNHTTSCTYDANDNLTQITNALGYSTNMSYDNNDFMTALSFQGATRSYTYNRDGTLASFTSPNGHTFNYTYNSNGELTSDGYASYSYNSKGQLSTVSKDGKSISYSYDAFGRVSSISYDGKTVSYTYDNNGNLLTMVYPGNKTVTYTYDAADRMTSVTDWNSSTTTYTYRNDNQLSRVQYPNNVRTTYSYDNSGRLTGMTTARNHGNGSVIAQYSYTLDNNGNHLTESHTAPYASPQNISSQSVTYQYGANNRVTSAGNINFNYDNNGNTTSKTGRTMTYDNCNNLTSVSGNFNASYSYDGLGNRRSATRNGSTTKYVLNLQAGNPTVLMETNSSGTAQNYYIYGADGLISRIGADGSTTRYYVCDHRGSIVAMTDATTSANITHKYQYDDFGALLQSEEADENLFRYVGKYGLMYEAEDLYFVRARYYDPSIGRFLSEDPIWSTNLYPYADNNPIMSIDPSGEDTMSPDSWLNWQLAELQKKYAGGKFEGDYRREYKEIYRQYLWKLNNQDVINFVNKRGQSSNENPNMPVVKPGTTQNKTTYYVVDCGGNITSSSSSYEYDDYSSWANGNPLAQENWDHQLKYNSGGGKVAQTEIWVSQNGIQAAGNASLKLSNTINRGVDKLTNWVMPKIIR